MKIWYIGVALFLMLAVLNLFIESKGSACIGWLNAALYLYLYTKEQ